MLFCKTTALLTLCPEASVCWQVGTRLCGKIIDHLATEFTQSQQSAHLEGVVAFLDCIPSLLLSSCVCFSTPLLVTDAVATITVIEMNANLFSVNYGSIHLVRPPVFIICCSVLPRLLLLLTPTIPLTARIVMRIAGHPPSQAFFLH